MPGEIQTCQMWWHGPSFLEFDEENWTFESKNYHPLPEMKSTVLVESVNQKWKLLQYFGQFIDLQRLIARVLRFINNSRTKPANRQYGLITAQEMSNSLQAIIRAIQLEEFSTEYQCLKNGGVISKKSPLYRLNVFMDNDDLIRVGGRITNSNEKFDVKHQLVLPKGHHVTKILIRMLHEQNGHVGQRTLLSIVRQRFWPVDAKNMIRHITNKCVVCFRCNPTTADQMMGDLPSYRTISCHPFFNTGIDYAGPFLLKKTRNTNVKGYAAIFVCLATKSTHIELVSELSTKAFLAALDRFISRRGHCKHIFSDNGTNFVGAKSELQPLFDKLQETDLQERITRECSERLIEFHFIPPKAPHFGGLWEATVKQLKYHLQRIVGLVSLTFEEMSTVFSKVEAILNSRPLFAESNDPEDMNVITPGHILIGRPLLALVEPNYKDVASNRLNRWQMIQQLGQHLWERFSFEYVTTLQSRCSTKSITSINVGMLVVVKEDNQPPLQWLSGRITEIHPGRDNIVRVVTIKTQKGTIIKRPIVKIAILPLCDAIPE